MDDTGYVIACCGSQYGGQWLVVRLADRRVMASGGVWTCISWMRTWAPMDRATPKLGTPLSPYFVLPS